MDTAPRRELPQLEPAEATHELARHLRFLLDRAGLTPRQLAADDQIPYSLPMLYRFFSGEELPPPYLIEMVARRCGGDLEGLYQAYDRAFRTTTAANQRVTMMALAHRVTMMAAGQRTTLVAAARRATVVAAGQKTTLVAAARRATVVAAGQKTTLIAAARRVGARLPRPAPSTPETSAEESGPATTRKRRFRHADRQPLVTAGIGVTAVGALVLATAVTALGEDGSFSENQERAETPLFPAVAPDQQSEGGPAEARPETGAASPSGNSTQLVRNGTFDGTVSPWWDTRYIRVRLDRNRLRARIRANSGSAPEDAMVMQVTPPLRAGQAYKLTFRAATDQAVTFRVTLQGGFDSATTWFSRDIQLGPQMRRFTFRLKPKHLVSYSILSFQVGGHRQMHSMWLDDVSLVEQPVA